MTNLKKSLLICLLILSTTFFDAQAQNFWQAANGPYGGSVSALAFHPSNGHIFIGGDPNSVFRSTNGGQSWSSVQNDCWNPATKVLACGQTGILYNGTTTGLFYSTNEGANWNYAGSPNWDVIALVVAPGGSVFVGTKNGVYRSTNGCASFDQVATYYIMTLAVRSNGTLIAGTYNQGIYRSTDNGANWTQSNAGYIGSYATALYVDPVSGNFYAGSDRLHRSTDDGLHWSVIGFFLSPLGIAVQDSTSFIFVGMSKDGVHRSTDNGITWQKKSIGLKCEGISGVYINSKKQLFALTNAGIFISRDNGENWYESTEGYGNTNIGSLLMYPPGIIFAGDRTAGLFCSTDAGASWQYWKEFLPYWGPLSIVSTGEGQIFVVTLHSLHRSDDSGKTWSKLTNGIPLYLHCLLTGDSGYVFMGSWNSYIYRTTDNGSQWGKLKNGLIDSCIHSLVYHRATNSIYAGTEHDGVYRSTDNGDTWIHAGSGLSSVYIEVLAVDQNNGNVYAATHEGVIHISTNQGTSWTNIQNGRTLRPITSILVHPSGQVFLGTTGGGVERSTNQGISWETFGTGVNSNVESLAIDSNNILYAGTISGVQKTTFAVPVELISFHAQVRWNQIFLSWDTGGETNNYGFAVERKILSGGMDAEHLSGTWIEIGFIPGYGTAAHSNSYFFIDNDLHTGMHQYRLKQIDLNGSITYSDAVAVEVTVSVERFSLEQNYPKPFSQSTAINYHISSRGYVRLEVFDMLGRKVTTLVAEEKDAGEYTSTFSVGRFADVRSSSAGGGFDIRSGIYIYKLTVGKNVLTRKMIVMY